MEGGEAADAEGGGSNLLWRDTVKQVRGGRRWHWQRRR